MRRAKVSRRESDGKWRVMTTRPHGDWTGLHAYPTHAEALHAALAAVGLTPCNPEPTEAP